MFMKMLPAALTAIAAATIATGAPPATGTTTGRMVVTVESKSGQTVPDLQRGDLMAYSGKTRIPVTDIERLDGDKADMQLFILLDDSTSSSLGLYLPELKNFVKALPASTDVAIGYMRNGGFSLVQEFTKNHAAAAEAFRLPGGFPGGNGSPYFVLSYLAKHWPSQDETGRRTVLMLTDGIDRYESNGTLDDPYVNAAIRDVQKQSINVYSIYLRGAGAYPRSDWAIGIGQSRLIQVTNATGGRTYFEALTNPVSLAPFLEDLNVRLSNQYKLTLQLAAARGQQAIRVRTEVPGVKIAAPNSIYTE